jgi:hypothetical protein
MIKHWWLAPVLVLTAAGCASREVPEFVQRLPGVGKPKLTNEEQIAAVLNDAVLNDMQNGMQHGRVFTVISHVSSQYKDAAGRDYNKLRDYVAGLLKTYREIRITRAGTRIAIEGDTARVTESFGTVAIPYDINNNETRNLHGQLSVRFAKEGNAWKVVEWGPLT